MKTIVRNVKENAHHPTPTTMVLKHILLVHLNMKKMTVRKTWFSHEKELPGGWSDQRKGPHPATASPETEQHPGQGRSKGPLDGDSIRWGGSLALCSTPALPSRAFWFTTRTAEGS